MNENRACRIKIDIGAAANRLWPLLFFALLTACGARGAQPTPTPFPTPVVPKKPTYTVQRGPVVNTLEFRGRVSPVTEDELFFETDGYVRDIYVAQGDLVKQGDLLAELEISKSANLQIRRFADLLICAHLSLAPSQNVRSAMNGTAGCCGVWGRPVFQVMIRSRLARVMPT